MSGFESSVAVIVGIDAYPEIPPLQTAANDARRLAQMLREDHGYQTHLLVDQSASLAGLRRILRELAGDVTPDTRVLFYFAGHGVALDGDDGPAGYLLPQDASPTRIESFLPMQELHEALTDLSCRHLLVILDCCFAGAFRWSSTRDMLVMLPTVIHRERYERYVTDRAWQVLASAAFDEQALDTLAGFVLGQRGTRGVHSPFAQGLFDALKGAADVVPADGGDGVITAAELYIYLRDRLQTQLEDHTAARQTPTLWPLRKHEKGEYVFLVPGRDLDLPPAPELTAENNPYRGLRPFEETHSDLFFGRDRVASDLRDQVIANPVTIVLGASGTGKSSLVQAGLLARLRDDPETREWKSLPVVRPGATPLRALAECVDDLVDEANRDPAQLEFGNLLDRWFSLHRTGTLVLVLDQAEELVTQTRNLAEREQILAELAEASRRHGDRLRLILTLRSDFEPQFSDSPLAPWWMAGRFVVPALTQDEFREVIERPASERVLYFNPTDLVDRLINEVVQMPGALPLLSFTLSEMYVRYLQRRSDDRAVTVADYEALGGVVGALRHRASEEYEALEPAGREEMRHLMLRMVSRESGEITRRRVLLRELEFEDPAKNELTTSVVARLQKARLIVRGSTPEKEPYVEPAHDELVRGWDRLWDWIREADAAEADFTFRRKLTEAAAEWSRADAAKTKVGLLWQDRTRSTLLERILKSDSSALNRQESAFARRSTARWRRNRWVARVVAAGLAALAAGTTWAAVIAFDARDSERIARLAADSARDEAVRQRNIVLARSMASEAVRLGEQGRDELAALLIGHAYLLDQATGGRVAAAVDGALRRILLKPAFSVIRSPPQGRIASMALSPDGRTLAAGSLDSRVWLWTRDDSTDEPRSLSTGGAAINSLAFSGSSDVLALGSDDGSVLLWNRDSDSEPRELLKLGDRITALSFSPDGERLAVGASDGRIVIASLDGSVAGVLCCHTGPAEAVVFDPVREIMVSGGGDGKVLVWNLVTNHLTHTLPHESGVEALAVSADGSLLATGTRRARGSYSLADLALDRAPSEIGGGIWLWNLAHLSGPPQRLSGTRSTVRALAFGPSGELATGRADDTVRIWSGLPTKPAVRVVGSHSSAVIGVAFDKEGRTLASSGSVAVRSWHMARALAPLDLAVPDAITQSVAFGRRGLLVSASSDGFVRLWRPFDESLPFASLEHEGRPVAAAFLANSQVLAVGMDGGRFAPNVVKLWRLDDQGGSEMSELSGFGSGVRLLATAGKNDLIVAAGELDREVQVWLPGPPAKLDSRLPVSALKLFALAVSDSGSRIVAGGESGYVGVHRRSPPGLLTQLKGLSEDVTATAFDNRRGRTAAGDASGMIAVWEPQSTAETSPSFLRRSHDGRVHALLFGSDGEHLISGGEDGFVRIWNLENPEAQPVAFAAPEAIRALDIDPEGGWTAAASDDGFIRLWPSTHRVFELICSVVRRELSAAEFSRFAAGIEPSALCSATPPDKRTP